MKSRCLASMLEICCNATSARVDCQIASIALLASAYEAEPLSLAIKPGDRLSSDKVSSSLPDRYCLIIATREKTRISSPPDSQDIQQQLPDGSSGADLRTTTYREQRDERSLIKQANSVDLGSVRADVCLSA